MFVGLVFDVLWDEDMGVGVWLIFTAPMRWFALDRRILSCHKEFLEYIVVLTR